MSEENWNEIEFNPRKNPLKDRREAWEQAEREGKVKNEPV